MPNIKDLLAKKEARIDELHRSVRGRTALLVVDMQRAFVDSAAALEVPQAREIIPNVKALIACCREVTVPVIVKKAGTASFVSTGTI